MNTIPVTVTFDANTRQITCSVPKVTVDPGEQALITWSLVTKDGGDREASFAPNGINFVPGTLTPGNIEYSLSDDNKNNSGHQKAYLYGINVFFNGETYTLDPEVANDASPPPLIHKSS